MFNLPASMGSIKPAAPAGPVSKLPGTASTVDNFQFVAWNDINNIKTDDSSYATAGTANIGSETDYLIGTNFSMGIPNGSTIVGIRLGIKGYVSPNDGSTCPFTFVKLVRGDGSDGSTNKSGSAQFPTSDGWTYFGGAADLWGQSWAAKSSGNTDADNVNSVNFGASMKCMPLAFDFSSAANVNAYEITIWYS